MTKKVLKLEPIRPRCKVCGYKVRGPNHEQGDHHKGKVQKMKKH